MLESHPVTLWLFLGGVCSVILALLALGAHRGCQKGLFRDEQRGREWDLRIVWSVLGFGMALGLRVFTSGQGFELGVDAQTFQAWGAAVARMGTHGLYASEMMIDYPPLYLWILGFLSTIQSTMGWGFGSTETARLFHLGPLLADTVFAYSLSRFLVSPRSKKPWGERVSLHFLWTGCLVLTPTFFANGSLFGQVDSVPLLFLFMAAVYLARSMERLPDSSESSSTKALCVSAVFFVLAFLTKPIAILFGPLGFVLVFKGHNFKRLAGAGASGVLLAAVILALASSFDGQTLGRILSIYGGTFFSYPYVTLNAANIYALFGLNWHEVHQQAFLGATWAFWGKVLLMASLVVSSALAWRDVGKQTKRREILESVLFYGGLCLTLIFVFVDQMHERYLFIAAGLLLAAACVRPSTRGIQIAITCMCLSALNHTLFLDFHYVTKGYHVLDGSLWLPVLSAAHLVFSCFLIWCAVHRAWITKGVKLGHLQSPAIFSRHILDEKLHPPIAVPRLSMGKMVSSSPLKPWSRLPANEMLLLTLLVSFSAGLSFFRLGASSSPMTFWRAGQGEDTVRTFRIVPSVSEAPEVAAFIGLGQGFFQIEISTDGQEWTNIGQLGHQTIFDPIEWLRLKPKDEVREGPYSFIRIRYGGQTSQLDLHELVVRGQVSEESSVPSLARAEKERGREGLSFAARDTNGEFDAPQNHVGGVIQSLQLVPVGEDPSGGGSSLVDIESEKANVLTDEQQTYVEHSDARHGMIFDEVYHVRSAWEEINGDAITETSHPPLGKSLIGAGIAIFGFHPWGWRVIGVLFGLALIPLVFLCTRLLVGGGIAPLLAATLFSFDFMRYTQTRLATLDGIAVFFVLAVFACLLAYGRALLCQRNFETRMALIGLTAALFGLGVAAKWSVVYLVPVIVFVLIYFALCSSTTSHSPHTSAFPRTSYGFAEQVSWEEFMKWLRRDGVASAMAFCLLSFSLYFLAFAWTASRTGEIASWANFWTQQKSMFAYHSQLNATHPFSSSWWEWPFILRPLWVYASEGSFGPGNAQVHSIVSMGHPFLWWMAPFALCVAALNVFKRAQKHYLLLVIGALGLYLPWAISPRSLTLIYHFFPVVPFFVMIQALLLAEQAQEKWHSKWVMVPVVLCAGLFVLFFPVLSGYPLSRSYIDGWLRWFPSWVF